MTTNAQNIKVQAGQVLALDCQLSDQAEFRVGEPLAQNELFLWQALEHNRVILAPLKLGEHQIKINCEGEANKSWTVEVVAPEEMPEHAPPVAPLGFAYPLWFWLLLILFFGAFLGGGIFAFIKRRQRLLRESLLKPTVAKLPDVAFFDFIRLLKLDDYYEKMEGEEFWDTTSKAVAHLRKYVEFRLDFHAPFATSSEFMAAFRQSLIKKGQAQSRHQGALEALLMQADQIRFSKLSPSREEKRAFVEKLNELYLAFLPEKPAEGRS